MRILCAAGLFGGLYPAVNERKYKRDVETEPTRKPFDLTEHGAYAPFRAYKHQP